MMGERMSFIDLCAGIGGGRLGLEAHGLNCVGYSEIDKDAAHTYKSLYGDEKAYGDLTKINLETLPKFDVLISGFPCQTFSIVGKRHGLEDEDQGQIIYYIAKILERAENNYFILENVKGLVNHDGGRTFKIVLELLNELGYKVYHSILNSIDYGVPQMRERIYLVGIKNDTHPKNKVFEFPEKIGTSTVEDFLCDARNEFIFDENHATYQTFKKYLNNKYNYGKFDMEEILKDDYNVLDTRQSDLRIYNKKVPTLRKGRQGILYTKNGFLRKLSGYEALLLQGFSKDYAHRAATVQTNSKLLAQAGNAMTVNVIEAISEKLLTFIG